jgi:hypothetical protein
MKRAVSGACLAVAFTAVTVSAQDKNTSMNQMDHMSMEKTYSGCLESSQTGSFSLTHLMAANAKTSMSKSDAMAKAESMKKDDAMGKDTMTPASLSLSAPGKDLSKYVGHRVTVTGSDGDNMNGMATFKVKSLKTIGRSCS